MVTDETQQLLIESDDTDTDSSFGETANDDTVCDNGDSWVAADGRFDQKLPQATFAYKIEHTHQTKNASWPGQYAISWDPTQAAV